jgi:hypothetical protein
MKYLTILQKLGGFSACEVLRSIAAIDQLLCFPLEDVLVCRLLAEALPGFLTDCNRIHS